MKLYGSPFPTAAAINGQAPAGGCFLALCCEYRVMMPNYMIGLNESQLGIVPPWWFMTTMKNVISARDAELAMTTGKLFKTEEALRIGLIDEIAVDKAEAIQKCEVFLMKFPAISPTARSATKMNMRGEDIERAKATSEEEFNSFNGLIMEKSMQRSLGLYINFLKARKILKTLLKPFNFIMKSFTKKPKIKKSNNYSQSYS